MNAGTNGHGNDPRVDELRERQGELEERLQRLAEAIEHSNDINAKNGRALDVILSHLGLLEQREDEEERLAAQLAAAKKDPGV